MNFHKVIWKMYIDKDLSNRGLDMTSINISFEIKLYKKMTV
jgi:hypothetical protein